MDQSFTASMLLLMATGAFRLPSSLLLLVVLYVLIVSITFIYVYEDLYTLCWIQLFLISRLHSSSCKFRRCGIVAFYMCGFAPIVMKF